jgi:hypothetical protein
MEWESPQHDDDLRGETALDLSGDNPDEGRAIAIVWIACQSFGWCETYISPDIASIALARVGQSTERDSIDRGAKRNLHTNHMTCERVGLQRTTSLTIRNRI